jgi:hypothetical protein
MSDDGMSKKPRGRQFSKGESGNPSGRPKGARNRATLLVEALLDGDAERLIRKIIDDALAGDRAALRFCNARLMAVRRERPVQLDIAGLRTPADAKLLYDVVVKAIADGEMTPAEGCQMKNITDGFLHACDAEKKHRPFNFERAKREMFTMYDKEPTDEP